MENAGAYVYVLIDVALLIGRQTGSLWKIIAWDFENIYKNILIETVTVISLDIL